MFDQIKNATLLIIRGSLMFDLIIKQGFQRYPQKLF